ncbi:MAG: Uma2 family endonuclease [Desmonostoc geniculatum HA4340-LM1]|nr:Uma2 family endonuclease [Desmonostoc geniculatum HA4340-LM1]
MTQALPKIVTFEEFVKWKPENERYELHNGIITKMPQPVGYHEEVTGFLAFELTRECIRLNLPYFIPKTALVKPPENESGYSPDVLLLNRPNLINELLWKKESTISQPASIPIIVEVVSTNWRDDYLKKYADYEEMGIPEYWIVDYAALGGREFIGKPKQPTILIGSLDEGEYQISKFRGTDRIQSPTFPELNLTAQQIFKAGNNS